MYNQWTRTRSDPAALKERDLESTLPTMFATSMQFEAGCPDQSMVNPTECAPFFIGSSQIDADSDLRARPTNLNCNPKPQAYLYGTSPFQGRGIPTDKIDGESSLRPDITKSGPTAPFTEQAPNRFEFIQANDGFKNIINPTWCDQFQVGHSTRAELRNYYNNK